MKVKQALDNGNVTPLNPHEVSYAKIDNSSWLSNNTLSCDLFNNSTANIDNSLCSSNYNFYDSKESAHTDSANNNFDTNNFTQENSSDINAVCNRQYLIQTAVNLNFLKHCDNTQSSNLEGATETVFASRDSFPDDINGSTSTTPIDEERAFDHSDTDETSEHSGHPVPRGIVNPNYPGFQHLAHTLQDYSSNIENFYQSENDMTDDDVEQDITESTYESEQNLNIAILEYENTNDNNNNKNEKLPEKRILSTETENSTKIKELDSYLEIPDLLKTITINNNNNYTEYETNCTDADIENHFLKKDIIGDFNKEIEDEIKQLLNYNINIEEDLEELRKDIKDTFTKPIENTINNISDVVNHVIKKLVKTHCDVIDVEQNDNTPEKTIKPQAEEIKDVNEENEKNIRTEMNHSRPKYLLIHNCTEGKITDALLSDGKDEIKLQYETEYDTEAIHNNVERTIQQLSTELRKIIPKLEEMRECDRLWNESKKEAEAVLIDGNSNEIPTKRYNFPSAVSTDIKPENSLNSTHLVSGTHFKRVPAVTRIEPRPPRDWQKEINSAKSFLRSANSNTSVRKSESAIELDIGSFDVYNIETALPELDFDAIESHLKAAKEAERRSLVTNIKRRFSKTPDEINERGDSVEITTGFKRSLHLFKTKLLKSEPPTLPVNTCDNLALSPRAIGLAECAQTDIEWPLITDNNPNILEKFTRIVTITNDIYEQRKRNDREEIRKRLAMGVESEEYHSMGHIDRPGRKPSLHSRLQNGMNLQICFMNETASDNESQASDVERNPNINTRDLSRSSIFSKSNHPYQTRPLSVNITKHDKINTTQSGLKLRPTSFMSSKTPKSRSAHSLGHIELKESDFYALQATLQTEARIALAQAKEMARVQMERERRSRAVSPVTEMLRRGMEKASAPLAADRRRVSRQLLTDMNIAQLQVIVNELHSQIESLNEQLVKLLMARDELHMGQDSMLVDIEDLTRYLGVKEQTKKTKGTAKSGVRRLASLVSK